MRFSCVLVLVLVCLICYISVSQVVEGKKEGKKVQKPKAAKEPTGEKKAVKNGVGKDDKKAAEEVKEGTAKKKKGPNVGKVKIHTESVAKEKKQKPAEQSTKEQKKGSGKKHTDKKTKKVIELVDTQEKKQVPEKPKVRDINVFEEPQQLQQEHRALTEVELISCD